MEGANLAEIIKDVENSCKKCRPMSMLECVNNCVNWRLKNEFRELHKAMQNLDFVVAVLNALKNVYRQQILSMLSKHPLSAYKLQLQLKTSGHTASQSTIEQEYLAPLVQTQLVVKVRNDYAVTTFGSYLSVLIQQFPELGNVLPPHSECYEEITLAALLERPKTFEELKETDEHMNSLMRVLSRLEKSGLVSTSKEREHIFFFKSKRDPSRETLSPSMKQIYDEIPIDGIAAKKLAKEAGMSLRRAYKFIRNLKGKKLVFVRDKPRTYALTADGTRLAQMLMKMHEYAVEAFALTEQLVYEKEVQVPMLNQKANGREDGKIPLLTSIQCLEP